MGLFGSKKKYFVDSLVQPIYPELEMDDIPSFGDIVLGNVLRDSESITMKSDLIGFYRTSVVNAMDKVRRVAEKSYSHGLPTVYKTGKEFLRDHLVTTAFFYRFGIGLTYNRIIEGFEIVKQNLRFVGAEIYYYIKWRKKVTDEVFEYSLPISELREVVRNEFYTPARYTPHLHRKNPEKFPEKEWYEIVLPTSTRALSKGALDRVPTEDSSGALFEMYPAICVARDRTYLADSVEYMEAKQLLSMCKLDIDMIIDNLKEGDDEGQLQAAFVVFGTTLAVVEDGENHSLSKPQKQYIHNFFSYMEAIAEDRPIYEVAYYKEVRRRKDEYDSIPVYRVKRYIKAIDLVIKEGTYNSTYCIEHILKSHVDGWFGSFGDVDIQIKEQKQPVIEEGEYYAKEDPRDYQYVDGERWYPPYARVHVTPKTKFDVVIKKQEAGYYSQIEVFGLSQNTVVKLAGRLKEDMRDKPKDIFIPFIKGIVQEFDQRDQQELFYRGLHLSIYAGKVVKLKWYQTGLFQAILIAAAIVLTVLYPPSATITWQGVLTAIGYAIAIKFAVRMIIKAFPDSELAQIVAIAAAVYVSFTLGGMGAASSTPTAVTAIQVTTMTLNFYADTEMQQLAYKQEKWNAELEQIQEEISELDTLMKELVPDFSASGLEVLHALTNPLKGETPEQFYLRTLNADPVETVMNLYNHLDLSNGLPTV